MRHTTLPLLWLPTSARGQSPPRPGNIAANVECEGGCSLGLDPDIATSYGVIGTCMIQCLRVANCRSCTVGNSMEVYSMQSSCDSVVHRETWGWPATWIKPTDLSNATALLPVFYQGYRVDVNSSRYDDVTKEVLSALRNAGTETRLCQWAWALIIVASVITGGILVCLLARHWPKHRTQPRANLSNLCPPTALNGDDDAGELQDINYDDPDRRPSGFKPPTPPPPPLPSVDYSGAPPRFFCPITDEVMRDPVMTPDGINYERAAIFEWLAKQPVCPQTRHPLSTSSLFPNRALREEIVSWGTRDTWSGLPEL